MDEQQYTKWFNLGYELSKHKPRLSLTIANSLSSSKDVRALGFTGGQRQYSLEKENEIKPQFNMKRNYNRTTTRNNTKDKGPEQEL